LTIDSRNIPQDTIVNCDICIVGGGAAGITLAKELIGKSYQVILLESGGLQAPDELTNSLRDGENIGLPYFPIKDLTNRALGGNTSRWANFVVPFEEIDFEKRDWVPYSGWPFTRQTLMPYYERANKICGIEDFNYDPNELAARIGDPIFRPMQLDSQRITTKMWRFYLPPLNFKTAYFAEIQQAPNIETYLYANVVEITVNDAVKRVDRIRVATVNDTQFWVSSRAFILAMGGVEIPRVMLASNQVQKQGVGNQNDLVGRFYQEHPHFYRSAIVLIPESDNYPALYTWEAMTYHQVLAGLGPTRALQEQEQILNGTVEFANYSIPWASGLMANGFLNHVQAVLSDLGSLADRSLRNARFRQWFGFRPYRRPVLYFKPRLEQAPNPDSRITLSTEKDRLGLPRIRMNWQLTDLDRRTLHRINHAIAEEVGRAGLGRVRILYSETDTPWPPEWQNPDGPAFQGGWHYMGATRMHDDPKQGVVDADCRVHGLSNLYISSSSVFPTGSFANPTLTIVALALRLVEHLDNRLRTQAL